MIISSLVYIAEAMAIIKNELGDKLGDKRTKLNKAVQLLDDWAKWDEARIEKIIDETIEEFEGKDNDYLGLTD